MAKEKNVLDCEKKVMITCEYDELERFIKEEFNLPNYDIIADEELINDIIWTTNVESIEMDAKELINIIRKGNTSYKTRSLMNQLCFEGKIEAGEYAVDICW